MCVLSHFSTVVSVTLRDSMDRSPPGASVHGILQARILEGLSSPSQGVFPTQGWNPCLLHLLHWQAGSLPLAPPVKPKKPGVDCRVLIQGIFPTQGWNPGLLHCRQILSR